MGPDEILRFLEAVDAGLASRAGEGERLDLYLIGRSALILRYGLDMGTKDVDIVHFHGSRLELAAVELFGKGSANARAGAAGHAPKLGNSRNPGDYESPAIHELNSRGFPDSLCWVRGHRGRFKMRLAGRLPSSLVTKHWSRKPE